MGYQSGSNERVLTKNRKGAQAALSFSTDIAHYSTGTGASSACNPLRCRFNPSGATSCVLHRVSGHARKEHRHKEWSRPGGNEQHSYDELS